MPTREDTFLSDDLLRQLMGVGEVDLLVGINSQEPNGASAIIAEHVEEVCLRNFVRDRVALVTPNGDGSAPTLDSVDESEPPLKPGEIRRGITALRTIHRLTAGFEGEPDNGHKARTLLAIADLLRAKTVAVVTPPLSTMSPDWLVNLVRPVRHDNFDFVAPLYRRSWNQGLLTRTLLYPMIRAIFGHRIREPYSEDFAVSGRLATQCLDREEWKEEAVRARPESWLVSEAIAAGAPVCQAYLGQKDYPASVTSAEIVQTIRNTVGSLFWLIETHSSLWLELKGSKPIHTVGPEHDILVETDPTAVNRSRIQEMFRTGVSELEPVLQIIVSPETNERIQAVADDDDKLEFPAELWVRTLYEFVLGYHRQVIDRGHLVQALVPLYRGLVGVYLEKNRNATPDQIEADCEALCIEFEKQKPFLVERWNEKRR
jgi:glucosylglycerate synthase